MHILIYFLPPGGILVRLWRSHLLNAKPTKKPALICVNLCSSVAKLSAQSVAKNSSYDIRNTTYETIAASGSTSGVWCLESFRAFSPRASRIQHLSSVICPLSSVSCACATKCARGYFNHCPKRTNFVQFLLIFVIFC
jgi:hypothetical protein